MTTTIARGSLHQRTYELLKAREKTLLEVHQESGVPFYWLRRFLENAIPNPSVNRVQALYEYLSQTTLTV